MPFLPGLAPTFTFRIGLLAALLLAPSPASAQSADTLGPASPDIDRLVRERVASGEHVGLVVGVADGAGVRTYAAGTDGRGAAVDGHTLFEIGSVSKVLTTTALAALAVDGTVDLDAPIDRWLPTPAPRYDGRAITLRHLATHRSGLPRLPTNLDPTAPDPYAAYGAGELLAFLSDHELLTMPGTWQAYSNVGTGLLGYLLGEAADTTYGAVVRAHVLAPLGLADTYLAVPPAAEPRLARGHREDATPAPHWHFDALAGAGAYRSSATDLLTFLQANLAPAATPIAGALEWAQAPQPGAGDVPGARGIGLGWLVRFIDGEPFLWHNGGTAGFRSFVGFSRSRGAGVVVLTNSQTSVDALGWQILGGL